MFKTQIPRIPDDDTGTRQGYVGWQEGTIVGGGIRIKSLTPEDWEAQFQFTSNPFVHLTPSYDDYARDSFETSCRLRDQGIIPQAVRFQVSLPAPVTVVCCIIHTQNQTRAETLYEVFIRPSVISRIRPKPRSS
ncbi:uncharacterized protein RCO7_14043 [Rhynchosporium graminicola]|uniref:Uncharacterized protein n=2 Tax=Rhynchosporium TaxID=38037 RepID=A0A1E1MBF9_RHYSE|nr:uncharacterized protein RCO7_14043 [Rhynchosporium commune]CZT46441.1 uncharacterized protein RSE6_06867 [Rhynchosporium secalis]